MVLFYCEAFYDILEFDSFSSSSDEKMFERTCKQHQILFVASTMALIHGSSLM